MQAVQSFSDEILIAKYQESGNRRFVNELFERYYARVSAWCYRMSGDKGLAADLAQEVFMKIFRNLDSFRGTSKFGTWVYAIARNHCFSAARSQAARPVEEGGESLDVFTSDAIDSHTLLEQESAKQLMNEFVNRTLDPTEKQVMVLHYVEELPLESVTRILGLTNQSGAKSFVVSARRKLKAEFDRWQALQQLRK